MKRTHRTSIRRSFRLIQGTVGMLLVFLVIQSSVLWRVCRKGAAATDGLKKEGLPSLRYLATLQENLAIYRLHSFELMFAQEKDRAAKAAEMGAVQRENLETLSQLNQLCPDGQGHADVQALQENLNDYVQTMDRIQAMQAKDFEGAMKLLDQEAPGKVRRLNAAAEEVKTYCSNVATERTSFTVESFGRIRQAVLGLGSVGVILAALSVGLVTLSSWRVRKGLHALAGSLGKASGRLTGLADTVATASQSLAEGAGNQAASIEETSASLEEISSMTNSNEAKLQDVKTLAKQARTAAERGANDMQAMSSAMEAIKASSDDVAKIIKTIDEIAFQTNILALNAAVEAARAGEAGMGFAVVAEEVRNLAQRSAQAAKETSEKIEGAIGKTAQGVELNAKVAAVLSEIVAKARQVDELAAQVSDASREQTQGITQISHAVSQMDSVTQGSAASAEKSAAAAKELNDQARTTEQAVTELWELVGEEQETFSAGAAQEAAQTEETEPQRRERAGNPGAPTRNRRESAPNGAVVTLAARAAHDRSPVSVEGIGRRHP